MAKHFHIHLYAAEDKQLGEVHWHLYANPQISPQDTAKHDEDDQPDTANILIIHPGPNANWNVRPHTPGAPTGLICADGSAFVGSSPANKVWAFIFHHAPSPAELSVIPVGAVCGQMTGTAPGTFKFSHDTPPCVGSPGGITGQLGTEVPNARHSGTGMANWLAVWGVRGDSREVAVNRFVGITSITTACQVSGGSFTLPPGGGTGTMILPPLPAAVIAHLDLPSRKSASVRLEYSPEASQSQRPVWQSECGHWRLVIEPIEDSLLAQLDGRWPVKDEKLHVRWSGLVSPDKKRNVLTPVAPEKLLSRMSPVELEGTK